MIVDRLDNAAQYYGLGEDIADGLRFLKESNLAALDTGRHEIDGERLFAIVAEYETQPVEERFWEAHRKYIDIQCLVTGAERMGWAPLDAMTPAGDYDEANDLLKFDGEGDMMTVRTGMIVIFHPRDVHMPNLVLDAPRPVRKVVVKVRVE